MEYEILGDGRVGTRTAKVMADNGVAIVDIEPSADMYTSTGVRWGSITLGSDVSLKVMEDHGRDYVADNVTFPCGCVARTEYDYGTGCGGQLFMRRGWACARHRPLF